MSKDNINPPGPPSPPRCRHGKAGRDCPECREENANIKKLTNPLVDEWWERKGENISLYHIVFRAYHMGMRNEHLKSDIEPVNEELKPCPACKKPRGEDEHGAAVCPCPHCGDEMPF